MKARLSRSICSKARRASRRATSCAPHKFLQPVRKPSQYCGEGFLFWRESFLGRRPEFWRFVLHFWMFSVRENYSLDTNKSLSFSLFLPTGIHAIPSSLPVLLLNSLSDD